MDIFAEGVTTKETGSGLGLYIARQNMEEMGGSLRLLKSDFTSTDFEIRIKTAD
jgi:C4-dicarboxylate-specific signal transduction histidine kinase